MAVEWCVVVVVWAADERWEASQPMPFKDAMALLKTLRDRWGLEAFKESRIVVLDSLLRLGV